MNNDSFNQALRYRLLNILKEEPHLTQKAMADRMGVSVGKVNYCIKEFTKKGIIKVRSFRDSKNKKRYLYILTPKGMEERVKVSIRFLKSKMEEYDLIRSHIRELYNEMDNNGIEIPSGLKTEVESII